MFIEFRNKMFIKFRDINVYRFRDKMFIEFRDINVYRIQRH